MATVVEIPSDLLSGTQFSFFISRRNLTSTQTFTRNIRVSGPVDERWAAEISIPTKTREALDRYEALFDLADGMAGFLSAFDSVHAVPRGTATGLGGPGARFSDNATFSDGSLFAGGTTQSTIGLAAARGSEFVNVVGMVPDQAIGFAQGDMIGIYQGVENHGFLHRVISNAPTDSVGAATLKIKPRLREPVAVGQVVRFDRPRGVFRVSEEDLHFATRGPGGLGAPRLSLVEVPEVLTCGL